MIEIESVELAQSFGGGGGHFDLPRPGRVPSMAVRVAMWFRRLRTETPGRVHLSLAASPQAEPLQWDLRLVEATERHDVPPLDGTKALGFDAYVDGIDLFREFEVVVTYQPPSDADVVLGRLRGRRGHLDGEYRGKFTPLLLCSQGRMGSTALMRSLLVHPRCLAHEGYPYEDAQGGYLARVAATLLRTPDLRYRGDTLSQDMRYVQRAWRSVGANPFLRPDYRPHDQIESLVAEQARPIADFARAAIDRVYARAATLQGKAGSARYFLEKSMRPCSVNELLWLYPHVKLVLLTRDPRDVFRSARDFNAKRGWPSFLREHWEDDEGWIDHYSQRISCLVDVFDHHAAEQRIHLRFEDLMSDPRAELERLSTFVDPGTAKVTIDSMFAAFRTADPQSRAHRTRAPGAEIGGWHSSLSAAEIERISSRTEIFRRNFGYEGG